ncbi:very short patch repair endonuclease [Govanella unica]|uniref:Very short patch repair endonuclease n=1 Tax=Govanella unica TaxID=2975056 RepID=A0A9X3Z646_9PROT|nr:very short patch repair endonuclease [Govania unica]MDA5192795.1 very short patch repair endonuclease [Govania unica]
MADIVPTDVRSRMMAGIRGTNTKPELLLRKGLHRLGFRFRLHDRTLPGKPDIVLSRYRAVIFAHGCFWHGHDCHLFRWPSTRPEFWEAKITRNREVDARTKDALAKSGWRQAIIWECALRGRTRLPLDELLLTCADWLRSDQSGLEIRGQIE